MHTYVDYGNRIGCFSKNIEKIKVYFSNFFIKEVDEYESDDVIYISNICIVENYRGKKIGSYLIGYYIS